MANLDDFQTADKVSEKIVNRTKGIITVASPKEWGYGIRMDGVKNLENVWLNGKGELPGQVGEELEIEYIITEKADKTGYWFNIQKAINLTQPKEDEGIIPALDQKSSEIKALNSKINDFTSYSQLMNSAVDLCIRRGTILDAEIIQTFNKLLSWIETYQAAKE